MKKGQDGSNLVEEGTSVEATNREADIQAWTSNNSSTKYQHADYVSPNGTMHYNQDYAIRVGLCGSSPDSLPSTDGSFGGSACSLSSDEEWLGRTVILPTGQAVQLLHTARNCTAIGQLYEQSSYSVLMNSHISYEDYNIACDMNAGFCPVPLSGATDYPPP